MGLVSPQVRLQQAVGHQVRVSGGHLTSCEDFDGPCDEVVSGHVGQGAVCRDGYDG